MRDAEERDLPAINALMQTSRAYSGAYRRIIEDYAVTPAMLKQNRVIVAERDGALVGFFSLILDSEAELDLLFVADRAQNGGIGSALMAAVKSEARKAGHSAIRIVSHPPAVTFYERAGAVRCGTSPATERVMWERPIMRLATVEN